mgnify:CR=1 FL=1
MTQPDKPYALRLADECEESASVWANEIDTRQRAAKEMRRLQAEVELLRSEIERRCKEKNTPKEQQK